MRQPVMPISLREASLSDDFSPWSFVRTDMVKYIATRLAKETIHLATVETWLISNRVVLPTHPYLKVVIQVNVHTFALTESYATSARNVNERFSVYVRRDTSIRSNSYCSQVMCCKFDRLNE